MASLGNWLAMGYRYVHPRMVKGELRYDVSVRVGSKIVWVGRYTTEKEAIAGLRRRFPERMFTAQSLSLEQRAQPKPTAPARRYWHISWHSGNRPLVERANNESASRERERIPKRDRECERVRDRECDRSV